MNVPILGTYGTVKSLFQSCSFKIDDDVEFYRWTLSLLLSLRMFQIEQNPSVSDRRDCERPSQLLTLVHSIDDIVHKRCEF